MYDAFSADMTEYWVVNKVNQSLIKNKKCKRTKKEQNEERKVLEVSKRNWIEK